MPQVLGREPAGLFWIVRKAINLLGGLSKHSDDIPDPLRLIVDSHPQPSASLTSAPPAFEGTHTNFPLPYLSSLALQPAHSLLPPLLPLGRGISRKMASDPVELELEVALSSLIWVLEAKLQTSARTVHALNCQVISPGP